MKKLLITTLAAVSVGLCAKAEDTGVISETSFEGLEAGSDFNLEENKNYWQKSAGEDDLFKIIDVVYPQDATPQHWDLTTGEKALSIDTANPILRNVKQQSTQDYSYPAQPVTTPVFFDSVVQFTATDVAPLQEGEVLSASEGGNNVAKNKLMVWLYSSPEDLATTPGLFNEESAITKLVVTAGFLENDSTIKVKHYPTDVPIAPESWHRLTIKSFEENDYLKFNVWVDGNPIKIGDGTEPFAFDSMVEDGVANYDELQGVAFDGKGAVDDIVFTTTDPFYKPPAEVEKANFKVTFSDFAAIDLENYGVWYDVGNQSVDIIDASTDVELKVGDSVSVHFGLLEGYELVSPVVEPDEEGFYVITIDALTADGATIAIETKKSEGGEEPEEPAKPTIGGNPVDTAEAFIAAANSGATIKVPTDWTLDGNTLKYADDVEYATFADYYTVELATDGTVTLELNDTAKPEINETAADKGDAIVVTDAAVALGVTNAKAGLWYGAQAYSDAACTTKIGDEPTGWEKATGETVTVIATKPEGDKAFFKVVVDDQDHTPATPPAEQN